MKGKGHSNKRARSRLWVSEPRIMAVIYIPSLGSHIAIMKPPRPNRASRTDLTGA